MNSKPIILIDKSDIARLSQAAWRINNQGYIERSERNDGKVSVVLFHREILDVPCGHVTDHINGNKLDNRKRNLRVCTHAENMRNRKTHINNKSGMKGIYFDKALSVGCAWRAQIRVDGRKINLGRYETADAAHLAYMTAAKKYHGDFARAA